MQQKTKNAEQERDSVITAMRLLIAVTNSVVENNGIEQKLCNEVDEGTQSKDIINPEYQIKEQIFGTGNRASRWRRIKRNIKPEN